MFQCLTSIYFSLAEPLKSQAALQCAQRVNTLIEKCSFSQLMCNVTLAHIYLPGEGDERGKKKAHAGERGRWWTEREKEGNHPGEATDSKRQEPERPNDGDE